MTLGHPDGSAEEIARAADHLRSVSSAVPRLAVTLGSGLGGLVELLADPVSVPFAEVPPLPSSGVSGHAGRFVFGRLEGVDVVLQAGRVHGYQGVPAGVVSASVRMLAGIGVERLILTNASGGIRGGLEPGDLVLLDDQIDLSFLSPLRGPARTGEARFPDMSAPFDRHLRAELLEAATDVGVALAEGTYACVHGPSYETRAEVGMLARLGADVVGMSTVPEVIVARALGLPTAAISLVTNRATGLGNGPLSHEEVLAVGRSAQERLTRIVTRFAARLRLSGQSTGAK